MSKLYFYPKDHISISSLNSFSNCPFSFYLTYFLGYKQEEKDGLTFGKQFQELLNVKYKGEDVKDALQNINAKSRGLASLLITKAHDFEEIVSIDAPYEVDLGLGIPVMFIPDLLTKKSIIENKCTTGYYNSKMVKDERQATLYYVGIRKLMGYTPEIKYQIFNTKNQSVELIDTKRTEQDANSLLAWMEERLNLMAKCYDTGKWDIGTHGFCNFKMVCPLQSRYGMRKV